MEDKISLFYGIANNWECIAFLESDEESLKASHDLKNFRYIIERYEFRKSSSGKTGYYRTKILDSDLRITTIEYEGAKIWGITDEVWMNLEDFERDEVAVYWPGWEAPPYDPRLFLYLDMLIWEIMRVPSSFKICLVKLEDCFGYTQSVKTCISSVNELEILLKNLIHLSKMKSYSAFKLLTFLQQISTFENLDQEQNERAMAFFSSVIKPEYLRCKEYHPNIFHDFEDFDKLYENVRRTFFD